MLLPYLDDLQSISHDLDQLAPQNRYKSVLTPLFPATFQSLLVSAQDHLRKKNRRLPEENRRFYLSVEEGLNETRDPGGRRDYLALAPLCSTCPPVTDLIIATMSSADSPAKSSA